MTGPRGRRILAENERCLNFWPGFGVVSVCVSSSLPPLSPPSTVHADEPPIIAKARAYLGSEDALNGVKSIYLDGKFMAVDSPSTPANNQHGAAVEIIFQKPYMHRLVVTGEAEGGRPESPGAKIIVLDGYDAWQREANPNDPTTPVVNLLAHGQILSAARRCLGESRPSPGIGSSEGGSVQDLGPATIDGVACEKVAFIHTPTIVYYRYFDLATGRLVFTETKEGLKIREEGEIDAAGIKFPQKIITTQKLPTGGQRVVTLSIEHVTVNNVYSESMFAVPLPTLHLFADPMSTPNSSSAPATAQPSLPASSSLPAALAP